MEYDKDLLNRRVVELERRVKKLEDQVKMIDDLLWLSDQFNIPADLNMTSVCKEVLYDWLIKLFLQYRAGNVRCVEDQLLTLSEKSGNVDVINWVVLFEGGSLENIRYARERCFGLSIADQYRLLEEFKKLKTADLRRLKDELSDACRELGREPDYDQYRKSRILRA